MLGNIIAICSKCKHYRLREKPQLFSKTEIQSPGVLKAKLEWDQQEHERLLQEHQIFESGIPFTYEPFNYPWCEALTPYDFRLLEKIDNLKDKTETARQLATINRKYLLDLIQKSQNGENPALAELEAAGAAIINPVSGEIQMIYALCAQINQNGDCPIFESKT